MREEDLAAVVDALHERLVLLVARRRAGSRRARRDAARRAPSPARSRPTARTAPRAGRARGSIACRPSRPKQRSVAQSFSARKRRPSGEAYSLRLTTSSSTRRYSGTRLNARRRSSGRRAEERRAVHRREQPLVRVDADRVGPLPAGEVVAQLRADRGRAGVGRVDVQPGARRLGTVGDRGDRVDGGRRGRADRRHDRAGVGRGRARPAAARRPRRPAIVADLELEQPRRLRSSTSACARSRRRPCGRAPRRARRRAP